MTLSTSAYLFLTRLNNFTLSYYGSNSCLPTLKPSLTILVPRLASGSLLEITTLASHQLYYIRRTDARRVDKSRLHLSFSSVRGLSHCPSQNPSCPIKAIGSSYKFSLYFIYSFPNSLKISWILGLFYI